MAHSLNSGRLHRQAWGGSIDVSDWDSQRAAFEAALDTFGGTIDWVLPIAGIGERPWLPRGSPCDGFQRPNLAVIDVDQNGVLYTAALAIQHFRWIREKNPDFRGKSPHKAHHWQTDLAIQADYPSYHGCIGLRLLHSAIFSALYSGKTVSP